MRDAFALIIIMQTSKILISGFPLGAGSDTWISILLSLVGVLPLMLLYARLIHLMPGKNLFEMTERMIGRPGMVAVCILYAYYFLTTSSIVQGNYVEFMHLVSLQNTSYTAIMLSYFILCGYIAISGSETMGKWGMIVVLFAAVSFGALMVFSAPRIRADNLVFALQGNWNDIGLTGFKVFAMPFGEAILLLSMAGDLEKRVNPYKLLVGAGCVSAAIALMFYLHTAAMLGQSNLDAVYFPSYKAASVINIGAIGTRIEALIAFAFTLESVTKAAIGLYAGTRAIAAIFRVQNFWKLVFPVGLLTVAMSVVDFGNMVERFEYMDNVFPFYAVMFQAGFPLLLWMTAEIRLRKRRAGIQPAWRVSASE
jgi:spore germination protein KB